MTSSSSIISALGAGSGIDMVGLAESLANAQFQQRNDRLEMRQEDLEAKISAAADLRGNLSLLASAFGDRIRAGDLAIKPELSGLQVATPSSPAGRTGSGTYSLEVHQLAAAQSLTSTAFTSKDDVLGEGTLRLRFGAVDGTSFSASSAAPIEIQIAAGATLNDVAAAINGANAGVSAYLADTGNGVQLVLKGSEGRESGFVVEVDGAGGDLGTLAWNPNSAGDPSRLVNTSRDALFEVDGVAYQRSSNNTGEIAPGLQLNLLGTNTGQPSTISFSKPVKAIADAMADFVSALNEIASKLEAATAPIGGELASDPGARALKRALSTFAGQVVMPTAANDSPRTLADIGLATERKGGFRLDSAQLQKMLDKDPAGVAAMFTTGIHGVYSSLDRLSRAMSRSTDPGSLAGSIARYEALAIDARETSSELAEKQEALRASLVARFAKTESRISAAQSTLSYLQAQIRVWEGGND
ncbi:flagellar filament capping protein FliD [Sphingomicrobium astaxanthinifaciens]|uniref:flagellar filament capping protein FliD n=1 Tax=Sphingomicrobium astaxanthinifaciens TaxID=1227949 RepID=UPI001FCA9185|nr:flagellar filament capping protein FliD [Sphingomicrobium astaxanthinifaciens]MCJ7420353.1 flagellar filament capping protein FliD [Sphingomicrobium astaxanthinifaciens]